MGSLVSIGFNFLLFGLALLWVGGFQIYLAAGITVFAVILAPFSILPIIKRQQWAEELPPLALVLGARFTTLVGICALDILFKFSKPALGA